jgi:hypothetical protein
MAKRVSVENADLVRFAMFDPKRAGNGADGESFQTVAASKICQLAALSALAGRVKADKTPGQKQWVYCDSCRLRSINS